MKTLKEYEYKSLYEKLLLEIETYHTFYNDFSKHIMLISIGRGLLIDMYSDLIKFKKANPTNPKIPEKEAKLKQLLDVFDEFDGLHSKCIQMQLQLRRSNELVFKLTEELTAIKKAHNEK